MQRQKIVFFSIVGVSFISVLAVLLIRQVVTFRLSTPGQIQVNVAVELVTTSPSVAKTAESGIEEVAIPINENAVRLPEAKPTVTTGLDTERAGNTPLLEISVVTEPKITTIGSKYQFKFTVTNWSAGPVMVESVSADTFLNGELLRSTPHFFSEESHGPMWYEGSIEPGQTRVVYNGIGVRTVDTECGDYHSVLTFHSSLGDFEVAVDYSVVC